MTQPAAKVFPLDNGRFVVAHPLFVLVCAADGTVQAQLTGEDVLRLGETVLLEKTFQLPSP